MIIDGKSDMEQKSTKEKNSLKHFKLPKIAKDQSNFIPWDRHKGTNIKHKTNY